jgi:hypothetical protein
MYCLIHVSYWIFWIMWPAIIFDSMTCDGVMIDHVIDIDSIQKQNGHFHWLNFIKHDLSCPYRDHGFSPSSIKKDFKIGIWWFSHKLAAFREKSWPHADQVTESHRSRVHISCYWPDLTIVQLMSYKYIFVGQSTK